MYYCCYYYYYCDYYYNLFSYKFSSVNGTVLLRRFLIWSDIEDHSLFFLTLQTQSVTYFAVNKIDILPNIFCLASKPLHSVCN